MTVDLRPFLQTSEVLAKELSKVEKDILEDALFQRKFDNCVSLLNAIENAKSHGLEVEFLVFFIDYLCEGSSFQEAIKYANREWDI
ncbi:hypothetical protein EB118_20185 [bacterium]|nr:hypothetical protein [bacterium]